MLSVTISEGIRCKGGSVQTPQPNPRWSGLGKTTEYWWVGNSVPANGNLGNTHGKNVMFGLFGKIITCSVRIKSVRGP